MERTTVYLGTKNGKAIRKCVSAKNKAELQRKVAELKKSIIEEKDVYNKAYFADWANKWYEEIEKPKGIRETTLKQVKCTIDRLNEEFGKTELKKITLSMFQQYINELAECNPNTDKPMAKRTLKSIKEIAENIFCYASANNVAGVPNFFRYVMIPNSAPQEKRRALTIEEQQMIIDTPHKAQLPAMIMMFSGIRRGELLPLEWSDIDLDKGIISITKSVDFEGNQPKVKQGGKTENATRLVPIPPILINYLNEYKKSTKELSFLVLGRLYTLTAWKSLWNSFLADLNVKYGYNGKASKYDPKGLPMVIEKFTPHYLRHTYATLLFLQGVNSAYAMQFLGHSNIQTTVDVYTDIKNQSKLGISDEYKDKLGKEYRINIA